MAIIEVADGTISLNKLSATGTKNSTTYLRGDNTFETVAGGGKILQVLSATDSTERTMNGNSFSNASNTLSVTITPSATSSKIFIVAHASTSKSNIDGGFVATIYRGSTNLGSSNGLSINENTLPYNGGNTDNKAQPMSINYLDSPNTTSATTYQIYFRNTSSFSGHSTVLNKHGTKGSIVVMEVGA